MGGGGGKWNEEKNGDGIRDSMKGEWVLVAEVVFPHTYKPTNIAKGPCFFRWERGTKDILKPRPWEEKKKSSPLEIKFYEFAEEER